MAGTALLPKLHLLEYLQRQDGVHREGTLQDKAEETHLLSIPKFQSNTCIATPHASSHPHLQHILSQTEA